MLKTDRQVLVESKPESMRSLYDKYAGTLLGFIFEIVNDSKLAEESLVRVFNELAEEFGAENAEGPQNWSQLQRFAKGRLINLAAALDKGGDERLVLRRSDDRYLAGLSAQQKYIFLDIYYHGKTVAMLATELEKTEEFIRKTLKEAFVILRKSGQN
jgi:hypothetical protein